MIVNDFLDQYIGAIDGDAITIGELLLGILLGITEFSVFSYIMGV